MQNLAFGPGNEGREVFWNTVNYQIPLDVFALIALAIMGWGLYKRSSSGGPWGRPKSAMTTGASASRIFSETASCSFPSGGTSIPA